MNLADLISALQQAERTAERLWPNARTYDVKCFGEKGTIRRIQVTAPDTDSHSMYEMTLEH